MTEFEMVRDWLVKFGKPVDVEPTPELVSLAWSCIDEESNEIWDEVYDTTQRDFVPKIPLDKQKLTKELCDLIWVAYQAGAFFGLPMDEAFSRVYESNMSKLDDDGNPILREDGKILKGPNYKPADLSDLFAKEQPQ